MKKLAEFLIYAAIVLSGVWLILLALGVFGVINTAAFASADFNYIWALIIVVVGIALYALFAVLEHRRGLTVPNWFKNLFYIAFFVFSNIWYYFGLYSTIWGLIVFDAYLAIILNILSVSLFYNSQKDAKNMVKTTEKFLVLTCFSYAATGALIIEILSCMIRVICGYSGITASLAMFVTEACTMLVVCFIFALLFSQSMRKTKQLINGCLIKVDPVVPTRSKKVR